MSLKPPYYAICLYTCKPINKSTFPIVKGTLVKITKRYVTHKSNNKEYLETNLTKIFATHNFMEINSNLFNILQPIKKFQNRLDIVFNLKFVNYILSIKKNDFCYLKESKIKKNTKCILKYIGPVIELGSHGFYFCLQYVDQKKRKVPKNPKLIEEYCKCDPARGCIVTADKIYFDDSSTVILNGLYGNMLINDDENKNLMRGYTVIFNHANFKVNEPRIGTEYDVLALKNLFEKFNICYEFYEDFKFDQIVTEVERLKEFDFKDYSYLAVIILTHGDNNNMLCAYDQNYNLFENIINPIINNSTLVAKPKIFIIQACKDKNLHQNFPKNVDTTTESPPQITLPTKAEICLVFSTYEGYISERDRHSCGQFIQSLCKHIDEYGSRETIEVIMRRITKELIQNILQVPTILSTLSEEFFFCEKKLVDDIEVLVNTRTIS